MYALEAAAAPFFFRQFSTQIERFRVSNNVVSQCAELFANTADSAADAGHHHLFRFGTWLDGSSAWSAPERLIQAMPHKASQRKEETEWNQGDGRFRDADDTDEKRESRCCCFSFAEVGWRGERLFT